MSLLQINTQFNSNNKLSDDIKNNNMDDTEEATFSITKYYWFGPGEVES